MGRSVAGGAFRAWILALLAGALLAGPARAQGGMSLDQVVRLLDAGVRAETVLQRARGACVAFPVDAAAEVRVLAARGGTEALVAGLRAACVRTSAPAVPAAVAAADTLAADSTAAPPAPLPLPPIAFDSTWSDVPTVLREDSSPERMRGLRFDSILDAGAQAMRAGDRPRAIAAWNAALAMRPGDGQLLGLVANHSLEIGDLEGAVGAYEALLATADTSAAGATQATHAAGGLLSVASAYRGQGRRDRAVELGRRVRALDAGHFYALALLVGIHQNAGDWASVLPLARTLLELDPLDPERHLLVSNALLHVADGQGGADEAASRREAREVMTVADSLPVRMGRVSVSGGPGTAVLRATVTAGTAPPGRPISLLVVFTGLRGEIGRTTVTLAAPAPGQTIALEASLPSPVPVTGFRYRLP